MTRPDPSPDRDGRSGRKAVLTCPDCGHESPPDGDWDVREESADDYERETYRCPDCDATVTRRPRFAVA